MSVEDLRSEWQRKQTWSEGVFNSLERFVETKPEDNIEKFAETGDLDDLYGGRQHPSPKPTSSHQDYMQAYASQIV